MKQTKFYLAGFLVSVALTFGYPSTAQTNKEINYSYAGFGTNCNVFSASTDYGGYKHLASIGNASYISTDGAVVLTTQGVIDKKMKMTQYSIGFPFKKGNLYQIKVYCKSVKNSELLPRVAIKINSDNGGTEANCPGPLQVAETYFANYGTFSPTTGFGWSGFIINNEDPTEIISWSQLKD